MGPMKSEEQKGKMRLYHCLSKMGIATLGMRDLSQCVHSLYSLIVRRMSFYMADSLIARELLSALNRRVVEIRRQGDKHVFRIFFSFLKIVRLIFSIAVLFALHRLITFPFLYARLKHLQKLRLWLMWMLINKPIFCHEKLIEPYDWIGSSKRILFLRFFFLSLVIKKL